MKTFATPIHAALFTGALFLGACASVEASRTPAAPVATADDASEPAGTLSGVLAPANATALEIWPKAYAGELLVRRVAPHGSQVDEGQVVAELDPRWIDEGIEDARLALDSKQLQHDGLLARNRLAAEASQSSLARARASLDRARRGLNGFLEREVAFADRSDELSELREQHWLDDQKDELEQLEAMYTADELTDATEDIVLKRSRRDLAHSEQSSALNAERRSFRQEVTQPLSVEARREAVAKQRLELQHLETRATLEARDREDAEKRSSAELEKKRMHLERLQSDRELFTLRAPRAGLLVHGSRETYRSGQLPQPLRVGSKLAPRSTAMLVATPGELELVVDVSETQSDTFPDGAALVVSPMSNPSVSLEGHLDLEPLPTSNQGTDSTFRATIALTGTHPELVPGTHASARLASE